MLKAGAIDDVANDRGERGERQEDDLLGTASKTGNPKSDVGGPARMVSNKDVFSIVKSVSTTDRLRSSDDHLTPSLWPSSILQEGEYIPSLQTLLHQKQSTDTADHNSGYDDMAAAGFTLPPEKKKAPESFVANRTPDPETRFSRHSTAATGTGTEIDHQNFPSPSLHIDTSIESMAHIDNQRGLTTEDTTAIEQSSTQQLSRPAMGMPEISHSEKRERPTTEAYSPERKDRDTDESADDTRSIEDEAAGRMDADRQHTTSGGRGQADIGSGLSEVATPSTVSTCPSTTDEASVTDSLLYDKNTFDPPLLPQLPPSFLSAAPLPARAENIAVHHRSPSWEDPLPHDRTFRPQAGTTAPLPWSHQEPVSPPPYNSRPLPTAWGQETIQRVASFRPEAGAVESPEDARAGLGIPQVVRSDPWRQHHRFVGEHPQAYIQQQGHSGMHSGYTHQPNYIPMTRKTGFQSSGQSPGGTPPRNTRPLRTAQNQQRQYAPGSPAGPQATRSNSEVLKTLLRKKACLYEPDTSRAVALVSWLVGRELALEYGYFSRQQLQSGVHACVAGKIDSGAITRTKVNRCMQIILNSCFHYIIPRPDGTEEKGDSFRSEFAKRAKDDAFLLRLLPAPWNDLTVNKETVLKASLLEAEGKGGGTPKKQSPVRTPKASPRLKPQAGGSPKKEDEGDSDGKRAVLLCFNENVRCAEDVFRCHNEFIRDTASASNLQLLAHEWKTFFGKEAAAAPYLWGNIGIPMKHSELSRPPDALGHMSNDECVKFRTSWCAKRYDHDPELCGFAHVEVNGGWLRRDLGRYKYRDEFCPSISRIKDKRNPSKVFVINECPRGAECMFAHSEEEIMYHPNRYKATACPAAFSRSGVCPKLDICPNLHPSDPSQPAKKSAESRSPGGRHGRQPHQSNTATKNATSPPAGAPVLYGSPAPFSSFEEHLMMPGLQNLFRRHCSVARAHLRSTGAYKCCYSHFGDDWGILANSASTAAKGREGIAPVR